MARRAPNPRTGRRRVSMRAPDRLVQALTAPLRWMAARLRDRPDSEHEMSYNRLVFATIIVIVLLVNRSSDDIGYALDVMALYIPLALGVLCHILLYPGVSRARRFFAL